MKLSFTVIMLCIMSINIVQASEMVIVGQQGKIFLWHPTIDRLPLQEVTNIHQYVMDTYFDPLSFKLFVSTDIERLYAISLHQQTSEFLQVNKIGDGASCIFFDSNTRQPVWLKQTKDSSPRLFVKDGGNNVFPPTTVSHLFYPRMCLSPLFIPEGRMITTDFIQKEPLLTSRLHPYLNDEWLILGKSERFIGYGRIIAKLTQDGEVFHSTLLFHDLKKDCWNVYTFNETTSTSIYSDIVVIQGFFDIKGDIDAVGNQIQRQASGHWYFLFPGNPALISASLPLTMNILYATTDTAYIVQGQDIYQAALSADGLSEPEFLLSVPESTQIFRVYPIKSVSDEPPE